MRVESFSDQKSEILRIHIETERTPICGGNGRVFTPPYK